jgi:anti-anti-sigma factor
MAIRFEQYGDIGVVALDGELRGDEPAGELRRVVGEGLHATPVRALVVDFTAARFVDGRGLDALLWTRGRLGDAISSVHLAGLDTNCRKIFEMTRLDDRFEVHADVQAALKAMN